MPNIIKAYILVMGLAAPAMVLFYAMMGRSIGHQRIMRWVALWGAVMTAGFLLPSPWLYLGALAVIFLVAASVERTPLIPFLIMTPMVPAGTVVIPGFGSISMLFEIGAPLLLNMILMSAILFSTSKLRRVSRAGWVTDMFVIAWLILTLALTLRAPTFTHILRSIILNLFEFAPIYFAFSRFLKTPGDVHIVSAALIFSILPLCVAAMAETIMSWHFFNFIAGSSLFSGETLGYKFRDGALRAFTVTGNPIVWGYIAAIAGAIGFAVFGSARSPLFKGGAFSIIIGGLIASFSRGPWLQFALSFMAFAATGRNIAQKFGLLIGSGSAAFVLLIATPLGRRILALLPFFGNNDSSTIDYRQQLFDVSMQVIRQHPLFGVDNPHGHPMMQVMRQGEGIVDIVNSYLYIGLSSGVTGLFIFSGVFLSALAGVFRQVKRAQRLSKMLDHYTRAYFSALLGVIFVIATTSSVGQIPTLYWIVIALCVALTRIVSRQYQEARRAARSAQLANEAAA